MFIKFGRTNRVIGSCWIIAEIALEQSDLNRLTPRRVSADTIRRKEIDAKRLAKRFEVQTPAPVLTSDQQVEFLFNKIHFF